MHYHRASVVITGKNSWIWAFLQETLIKISWKKLSKPLLVRFLSLLFVKLYQSLLSHCSMSSDAQPSPLFHRGLLGGIRDPKASATCMSWGGAHYRSFDRKHFHFHGGCTYVLASSTDGTWAVYISTVCDDRGHCSKVYYTLAFT